MVVHMLDDCMNASHPSRRLNVERVDDVVALIMEVVCGIKVLPTKNDDVASYYRC